jgi:hypothetical protein
MNGYDVINQNLLHWSPILGDWVQRMERFCVMTKRGIYGDGELANFSVLLASASSCGYAGAMEIPFYSSTGGRLDIDLILNDTEARSEIIEGKFAWFENLDFDATTKKANQTLAEACGDFGRLSFDRIAIGVAFCCPSYTRPSAVDDLRSQIQESLQAFRRCDHDALAYCFPGHSITVTGEFYRNIICPGVVALLRLYNPRKADA